MVFMSKLCGLNYSCGAVQEGAERNYRRVSHLIRNLLEHTTDCVAVVPIDVALGIDIGRIYAEAVHTAGIAVRTRPEVAARTLTVGRPIVEVAGKRAT